MEPEGLRGGGQPTIRTIAVGVVPPFEIYVDGRLIAEHDSAAEAEAAYQALRANIVARAGADARGQQH